MFSEVKNVNVQSLKNGSKMLVFLERGGDGGGGWLGRKCVCGDDSVDASDGNDRSFATEAQSSEWRSHDKLYTLTGFWEEEKVFGWESKVFRWEGPIFTQISSFGLCSE